MKLKFPNQDELVQQLVDKLVANIANVMDEYTVIFCIALFFLLVILLSVVDHALSIIHIHATSLFSTIARLFKGKD